MPNIVRQVVEKVDDTSVNPPVNIGALARDVIDVRPEQTDRNGTVIYPADGNETGYTMAQFIDHYMAFMREVPFMFIGQPDGVDEYGTPTLTNHHVGIWLDTSVNSDTLWDKREHKA